MTVRHDRHKFYPNAKSSAGASRLGKFVATAACLLVPAGVGNSSWLELKANAVRMDSNEGGIRAMVNAQRRGYPEVRCLTSLSPHPVRALLSTIARGEAARREERIACPPGINRWGGAV